MCLHRIQLTYGARAIIKGGLNSLPKMHFPGGMLIGCDAGTLNSVKIKGNHTAMKSGMLAAETIAQELESGDRASSDLNSFEQNFESSWLYDELYRSRNFSGWMHKFPLLIGSAFVWIEQNIFGGKLPFTLRDSIPDHATMMSSAECKNIEYPIKHKVVAASVVYRVELELWCKAR
jgi:electron-transferring-flavoprotein dehydrogenase